MNKKVILGILGRLSMIDSAIMILPLIVSAMNKEWNSFKAFGIVAAGALLLGLIITLICKTNNRVIYAKDGFAIVAASWLTVSLIGALPFTISGEMPNYINAVFETVSGFTTTGASVLEDVEAMSHGMLFWRSFTHFIGGMGFLVFVMAIVPNISDRSMHIMRAEVPGPVVGKLVPRIKDTAKILYIIYFFMTVAEVILLLLGNMPLFDSLVLSFGSAGTGGFAIKADSIASYSPYCQWIIAVFMMLFGINFNVYHLLLIRHFKSALKSSEMWCYIGIITASSGIIAYNIFSKFGTVSRSIREAFFQVVSIMTTTGYATDNFDSWPVLSKSILLLLMFIGSCAGSTGGGLKVSRVMLLVKIIKKKIKKLIHPHSVTTIKFDGKPVDKNTVTGISSYFAVYIFCFVVCLMLISFENFDIETNFSAMASCFNNIGPGLAKVGPDLNFNLYSYFSKLVLSFAMLLGRLEIYPMLIFFSRSTWSKK